MHHQSQVQSYNVKWEWLESCVRTMAGKNVPFADIIQKGKKMQVRSYMVKKKDSHIHRSLLCQTKEQLGATDSEEPKEEFD